MKMWLKPSVVCKALDISRKTLQSYINKGLIEAKRLPSGHWRVSADVLNPDSGKAFDKCKLRAQEILRSVGLLGPGN